MPKQSSESERGINLDRLFAGATTATFIVELLAILVLIGSIVGYILVLTGIWDLIKTSPDVITFLLLIGGAIAFAIFMVFIGVFIRFHSRVKGVVVGKGIGRIATTSREGKTILTLFAFSVVFFFLAGCYAIYLLWKYYLLSLVLLFNSIYPSIILVAIAVIVVCLMVQGLATAVSRYAARVVTRLGSK